jgi:hypothetical protein
MIGALHVSTYVPDPSTANATSVTSANSLSASSSKGTLTGAKADFEPITPKEKGLRKEKDLTLETTLWWYQSTNLSRKGILLQGLI